MKIKKMYVAPECVAYMLPSGMLCQTNTSLKIGGSGEKVGDSSDIGFSKGFSGGVDDDTEDLWAEE